MPLYAVRLRAVEEGTVYVEAEGKADAWEKSRSKSNWRDDGPQGSWADAEVIHTWRTRHAAQEVPDHERVC